jgi:hypothetical protein
MSQNNYTLIEQKGENKYEVSNRYADTNESGKIYTVKTLEEAVKKIQADWQGADLSDFEARKEEWREKFLEQEPEEKGVVDLLYEILYKLDRIENGSRERVSENQAGD